MKTYNLIDKHSDLVCSMGAENEEEAIKLIKILVNQASFIVEEQEEDSQK